MAKPNRAEQFSISYEEKGEYCKENPEICSAQKFFELKEIFARGKIN